MSSFADAVNSLMVSSLDPSVQQAREFGAAFTRETKLKTVKSKAMGISEIKSLIKQAKEDGDDGDIIQAYKDCLAEIKAL